ncbi:MAG: hypothetical protein ACYTFQ_30375 [Planctomycetota bacterium]|jgi:hypothetical protein
MGLRHGTEVLYLQEKTDMDDIAQAEFIHTFCTGLKLAPFQLCIDGMGIGASVANRIEQTLEYSGITRFLANNDPTFNFQFADRYTELHWVIKDLLAHECLKVPWCPDLLRDLRQRQYVMMPTGKIKTEPKKEHRKRTGVSPDFLDLLIYLFQDINIQQIRRGVAQSRKKDQAPDPNRPWDDPHAKVGKPASKIMGALPELPNLAELMRNKG